MDIIKVRQKKKRGVGVVVTNGSAILLTAQISFLRGQ
jgi:hypothetical protein